jgi:hypothetical protein
MHISLYFVGVRWVGHTGRSNINALILLAENVNDRDPLEKLEVDRNMAYHGGRWV